MNPKKIWANLAVSDLGRTSKFYTALGFKPNGTHGSAELVSFLFGEDGFVINFFLRDILKTNLKAEIADAHHVTEVCYTISAVNKAQVDDWEKEIEPAGGKIISKPEEFGKG